MPTQIRFLSSLTHSVKTASLHAKEERGVGTETLSIIYKDINTDTFQGRESSTKRDTVVFPS